MEPERRSECGAGDRERIFSFGMVLAVGFLLLVSLAGIAVLILKYVPQRKIAWRDIWGGAFATAFFSTAGKLLIGLYLRKAAVGSPYGAAGSLVVIIVWVYSSAMIFLFGAEFTRMMQREPGSEP